MTTCDRTFGAFQEPLIPADIAAIVQKNLGSSLTVEHAYEIGTGMYNTTYRLEFESGHEAVFLRVAPSAGKQFRSERHMMRNEYATAPWLSRISVSTPKVLAADWTHSLIARDYLLQTEVAGTPAPEGLAAYPKALWHHFFRSLGALTAEVHGVASATVFGRVIGPHYTSILDWLRSSFDQIITDLQGCGADADDIRRGERELERHTKRFSDSTRAALLTGDLWTANVLLDPEATIPTVVGAVDFDRAEWGDPLADWPIRMARRRSPEDIAAFWEGYGSRPDLEVGASTRLLVYELRHLAAVRLENIRLGNKEGMRDTYDRVSPVLRQLIDEQ